MRPKLLIATALIAWNLTSTEVVAVGPGRPWRPSLWEAFFASSHVVSGTFESVAVTRFERPQWSSPHPLSYVRYQCEFRVHETLYGSKAEERISLTIEGPAYDVDLHWRPYAGSKSIVFVRSKAGNNASADDNVTDYRRIGDYSDEYVNTVRSIARILELPTVDEQARAVAAGCFSRNRAVQHWCMRTLAGKLGIQFDAATFERIYHKDPTWIYEHVGDWVVWDVIERVCFDDEHDFVFLIFCDDLLQDDPQYRRSQRRYEILWSCVNASLRGPPALQHQCLMWLFARELPNRCPERMDESFARIRKLVLDNSLPSAVRGISLHYIDIYASDATREQVADLLESQLLGDDGLIAQDAAIATMNLLTSEVKSGREPPERLMDVVRHRERCPQASHYWLRETEAKVKELSDAALRDRDRKGR